MLAICLASLSMRIAAPRRAQEDVTECQPVLGPKPLRIGCEIGRELLFARLRGSHVLGEKFHLLPHAAANDDVVAVQARRPALAIENLVADVVLDRGPAIPARSAAAATCARIRRRGWRRATPKRRSSRAPRRPSCRPGRRDRTGPPRARGNAATAPSAAESIKACTRSARCRRARSSSSGLRWAS